LRGDFAFLTFFGLGENTEGTKHFWHFPKIFSTHAAGSTSAAESLCSKKFKKFKFITITNTLFEKCPLTPQNSIKWPLHDDGRNSKRREVISLDQLLSPRGAKMYVKKERVLQRQKLLTPIRKSRHWTLVGLHHSTPLTFYLWQFGNSVEARELEDPGGSSFIGGKLIPSGDKAKSSSFLGGLCVCEGWKSTQWVATLPTWLPAMTRSLIYWDRLGITA
jgi:hypothetical protein